MGKSGMLVHARVTGRCKLAMVDLAVNTEQYVYICICRVMRYKMVLT